MRPRTIAALALWVIAGTSFAVLAYAQTVLSFIPGALWLTVTVYGAANLGAKYLWLGPDRILWAVQRIGALGVLPLITRLRPEDLENENRKKILAYIEKNPGASIQDVRTAVDVAWGTAVYHLDRLRKAEKVVSHRSGNHHRYWASGTREARLRRGWAVLEQPRARDIAMAVATSPGVHQGAICEALDVRAPSASKHLSRLERNGLVEKQRISRYTVYQPTQELETILRMQADREPETSRSGRAV